ncbi:2-oxopent-4-enoate/cis-2-oxohex-4-enoate hydratase [Collimonas sp. OK607]|uniref:2-oxopent-4-enoate hydratase n=1 Tax=Collimonas sp. OK607 TaxID=1798194 RepID=UPI0008E990A7|nr:2-oxopent-4-enoate hydratase [Collimonas sp. OK607]SFB21297.1 2-oxopent-4-enoate/cis-2-oxohex-4-enoate hydratase [Collimonas sp. OK607]
MNNPNMSVTLGDELYEALIKRLPVAPLTERFPELSLEDAYQIQLHMIGRRLAMGERVVGKKIGLTSVAVQTMLGVDQPDFGHLTSAMAYDSGATVPASAMIAPRAEGEIAFILKRDLAGPGITNLDVLAATAYVVPCFEIVDSRIRDWKIRIQDTVADNASSAAFVLGNTPVDPNQVDFVHCGMVVEKNGVIVGTGAGAAALGSPLTAVAWLANTLGRLGLGLKAGEVILSGALSALVPVQAGDQMRVTIGGIGSVAVRFN